MCMFEGCLALSSIIISFSITKILLCHISPLKGEMGSSLRQTEWRDDPNLKKLEEESERRGEGEEDREGQEGRGVRGGAVSENRS